MFIVPLVQKTADSAWQPCPHSYILGVAECYAKQHIVGKLFSVDTDSLLRDCSVQQPA